MVKKSFNIALIQLNSTDNTNDNLNKISELVETASKKADLVILPEHADGIGKNDKAFTVKVPSERTDFFSDLARDNGIYLHCGSVTEDSDSDKPFNTSILFSPNGEIIAKYSKMHLFDIDLPDKTGCRESNTTSAGNKIIVANTELGNIGLSICYDVRFPELYRKMAIMGADLMIVSANFTAQTGKTHWKPLLQARAIENTCYIAGVNQCGTKPQFEAYGHTMLISPWGEIIGELENEEGILYGKIDSEILSKTRQDIPSLKNRRKDIYG